MLESRRGREIPPSANAVTNYSDKATFQQLAATSAKYLLQDYLAKYNEERSYEVEGPTSSTITLRAMRKALEQIEKAQTPADLSPLMNSEYKLVRDAANDEMRIMEGLPPNSLSSRRWTNPEVELHSRMSVLTTQKQLEIEPADERFDVRVHGLKRPEGTVHHSYERFTHGLNQRTDSDLQIKQAHPDRPQR